MGLETVGVSARINLLLYPFLFFFFLDLITCLDTASSFLEPEFRYDHICDFFFLNVTLHLFHPHLMYLRLMYMV